MDYGELLFGRTWYDGINIFFCYRIDPVPFTGGHSNGTSYKHPKTTAEKRQSFVDGDYVRAKRTAMNLPDAYDDRCRSDLTGAYRSPKSWKNKKVRKQWMKGK